jgi:hypothetical protein
METSDSVKNIAGALCKVQAHLKPLRRNADNPFFKSNYTDLAAMTEALYPLLTAEGLSVVQGGDGSTLDTMLLHTSGEWIRTSLTMPAESNPQKLGSIVTYFRRYALAALVGAVSEGEDDDGNAAAHPSSRPATATPRYTGPPPTAPAAPPASGGSPASSLHVKTLDVSEGTGKNGKPYKRFTVTFSDGTRCSTFSETDAVILKNAKAGGLPVVAAFEKQGNFVNLVSVRIDGPAESSDDESVPF